MVKERLFQLLKLRKDKRYRKGLLQGAVSFNVISQAEWEKLSAIYVATLPPQQAASQPTRKGDSEGIN